MVKAWVVQNGLPPNPNFVMILRYFECQFGIIWRFWTKPYSLAAWISDGVCWTMSRKRRQKPQKPLLKGCRVQRSDGSRTMALCHGDNGRGGFDRWPDLNFERRPQLFKRGWERWELSIERIPASKPAQLQTFRLEPHSKEENWWSSWCFFDVPSWFFWRDLSSCLKQSEGKCFVRAIASNEGNKGCSTRKLNTSTSKWWNYHEYQPL